MDYNVRVKKTLVTDNGLKFDENADIAFSILNEATGEKERWIANIKEIKNKLLVLTDIEINHTPTSDKQRIVRIEDILPESCEHVYCD